MNCLCAVMAARATEQCFCLVPLHDRARLLQLAAGRDVHRCTTINEMSASTGSQMKEAQPGWQLGSQAERD
jgi:hypothetical protein